MGGSSGGSKTPGTQTPTPTTPTPPAPTPGPVISQPYTPPTAAQGATQPGTSMQGTNYGQMPLQNQTANAFTSGLNQYQGLADQSGLLGSFGFANAANAADRYNQMAGNQPFNINAGQLSNTNLSPYMNPYQKDVIDATMNEMNFQHGMRQQGIDDAAAAQNAFGGDRMYVQKALADRYHGMNQASTLAGLNQANFGNAQQMGLADIGNRLQSDRANQAQALALNQGGAQGLAQMGQNYSTLGGQFSQAGAQGLGNMANMGFGFGQDMQKNDMIMGQYQQQLQQQMMDAIKNQFYGFANQGKTGLEILAGGNQVGNTGGTTTNKNDPGALGYVGAGLNLLSLF